MVRGIGLGGINFQTVVQQSIHMYGTHAQNALNDPKRLSGAAGIGMWPALHIFG